MKTLKIFSLAAVCLSFTTMGFAQVKKETFKVSGNCSMCKSKIEKAAKEAGAKDASWDADTKVLTVSYKSSSTNTEKIQEKIAAVGYDNAGATASADAYDKLHGCCKYDRTADAKKDACCSGDTKCSEHQGKMDCCKDGKCTMPGHDGKDCCKDMNCCKDGKCTMPGHDGKDCCKVMDCCKDGKCTKEGHNGADCCKKS